MVATVQVDQQLVIKAYQLGHHLTQEAAVTQALIEYIQHLEQLAIFNLFGAIDYDSDYNYKAQRRRYIY